MVMARVLISGGSGLIGQVLRIRLEEKGYDVALLGRSSKKDHGTASFAWDITKGEIDTEALNNCDYIIHLAGANIGAKRWTPKRKQEIRVSRIDSANLLYANLDKQKTKLKAFISSSAIGYYGAISSEHVFKEADPPADDFLGRVCRDWEQAADQFKESGIRTVKIRTGIVLSKEGGALSKLRIPVKWGLGSPVGDGKQYMPWIHINDLCDMYIHALEQEDMQGAYNAVAPQHVNNKDFTRKLARAMGKPFWAPNVPAFALKLLFGEMSVMLLTGSRISPEKIREAGFSFTFPDLDSALHELLS